MLSRIHIILLAALVGGCADEPYEPARSDPPETVERAGPEEETSSPAAARVDWRSEVRLVPVTYDEWTRELAALEGSVVVVDYWATWCVPCRERFPKMVEMAERFEPRGVTFVSLSLDDRDDPLTIGDVTSFLESQDARMPNYLMDEIIPDAFEKLDLLGIPAVSIYDRDGVLHVRLTGDNPNDQFTEEDVEQAVLELIEARS